MKNIFIFIVLLDFAANAQHLVPYNMNGKWGYSDSTGKMIIQPFTNKTPEPFVFGRFAMFNDEGTQKGVIDLNGKVVVKPGNFESIHDVIKSKLLVLAERVSQTRGEAVMDVFHINGKKVIKHHFDFYNSLAIDKNRLIVTLEDTVYLYSINLDNGAALLIKKHKAAYLSSMLTKQVKNQTICYGYEIVKEIDNDYKYYKFDLNGKAMTSIQKVSYDMEYPYSETKPMMGDDRITRSILIKDLNGKFILDLGNKKKDFSMYDDVLFISGTDVYYQVKKHGKFAIADTSGKNISGFEFDDIHLCKFRQINTTKMRGNGTFLNAQFVVKKEGKYGIYSTDSMFNIQCQYDTIIPGNFYHYIVKKDHSWLVLNELGVPIIEPENGELYMGLDYETIAIENDTNIVIAIKRADEYVLKSNIKSINNYRCKVVKDDDRFLLLNEAGERGYCYAYKDIIVLIQAKYKGLYFGNTIKLNNMYYFLVEVREGYLGYVNEFGKEFFD